MGYGIKVFGRDAGKEPKRERSCVEVWYAMVWWDTESERDSEMGREEKSLAAEGPMPPNVSSAAGVK